MDKLSRDGVDLRVVYFSEISIGNGMEAIERKCWQGHLRVPRVQAISMLRLLIIQLKEQLEELGVDCKEVKRSRGSCVMDDLLI